MNLHLIQLISFKNIDFLFQIRRLNSTENWAWPIGLTESDRVPKLGITWLNNNNLISYIC